jgi:hypothetical protein
MGNFFSLSSCFSDRSKIKSLMGTKKYTNKQNHIIIPMEFVIPSQSQSLYEIPIEETYQYPNYTITTETINKIL